VGEIMEMKNGVGRPQIYNEERKDILLKIPLVMCTKIDDIAHDKGITRTELIFAILSQADEEEAVNLIKLLKETRKDILELKNKNSEILTEISRKIGTTNIYSQLKTDEFVMREINENKENFKKEYQIYINSTGEKPSKTEYIKKWLDNIYITLEEKRFKDGFIIKKNKLTKLMIKQELIKLTKDIIKTRIPKQK